MTHRFDWFEPERIYLTSGAASGGTGLNAFDNALRDAGITDFNLIRITSIAPAGTPVEQVTIDDVIPANGLFAPTIYEDIRSNEAETQIASAVGIGIPDEYVEPGMIFAYSCKGTVGAADEGVRQMVHEGMQERGCRDYSIKTAADSAVVDSDHSAVVSAVLFADAELDDLIRSHLKNG